MRPVAIVQHDADDGPAFFARWLQDQGLPWRCFAMHAGDTLPPDVRDYAGLCVLGGPMSANDPLPYFPQLISLLQQAVQAGKPVIGHCLGGQLLSRALGGTVQASAHTEIGWSTLEPIHAQASDWFGEGPLQLFQWHCESFSVPPQATPLLQGRWCANQAFVVDNRHLAMQFHCEVDTAKVRTWLALGAEEMQQWASPGVQPAEAILARLEADMARSQAIASHIYRRWAQGLQA